ncbi:unnamed protein product [Brassicogethes aeneus]|uniref:Uncharacterized protein n=1 Tax=Brassicogethes aeneus TaxID=1431903 RepID=A0A9P0F8T7_BRAAE|nr:unnamed protein product [Brassicogethes aeneus]
MAMNTTLVYFGLTIWICGCFCVPFTKEYGQFRKHSGYVRSFKCSIPKPRLVKSSTILKDETNVNISPEYAVLYECNCNGSCESGEMCRPTETKNVTLYFRLLFNNNTMTYISRDARNATACGCDKVVENGVNIQPDCQMDIL